jgi:hypothetical protein
MYPIPISKNPAFSNGGKRLKSQWLKSKPPGTPHTGQSTPRRSSDAVDGQFDDAIEPPALPPVHVYSPVNSMGFATLPRVSQPFRNNIRSALSRRPLPTLSSAPPHQRMPIFYCAQQPALPQNIPRSAPGQRSLLIPSSLLQQRHKSYPLQSFPGKTNNLPIAPRPPNPLTCHEASKVTAPTKKTPSRGTTNQQGAASGLKIVDRCTKETKVVTRTSQKQTSPFQKIIADHPSDLLIAKSFINPTERLPMMQYVERDEDRERPVFQNDLINADVLLGRGGLSNNHSGNLWFRNLVANYRGTYCTLAKGEKGQLARNICNYVRLSGGRFLERDDDKCSNDNACWYECGNKRAQAKCSQALREGIYNGACEESLLEDSGEGKAKTHFSDKRSQPKASSTNTNTSLNIAVARMKQIELTEEKKMVETLPPTSTNDRSNAALKGAQERHANKKRQRAGVDAKGEAVDIEGHRGAKAKTART